MTTAGSPRRALKAQARGIVKSLKAAARGEKIANDPGGKIAAALKRDSFTFGVAMDDKVIRIEMPWTMIRETDSEALAEWMVAQMQEATFQ